MGSITKPVRLVGFGGRKPQGKGCLTVVLPTRSSARWRAFGSYDGVSW